MKKKNVFYLVVFVVLLLGQFLVYQQATLAAGTADINDKIDDQIDALKETGLPEAGANPLDWIVFLIKGLLGVLGVVFLVLIIYAGVKWMTSGGNSSTIDDAKKMILNAVIGLVIIGFAFAITQFVFSVILKG